MDIFKNVQNEKARKVSRIENRDFLFLLGHRAKTRN
jgi:hypothetical protein